MRKARTIAATFSLGLALLLSSAPLPAAQDGRPTIVVEDLHYGEVLFHFYKEDYFTAIVRLLASQSQSNLDNHIDDSELLLGGMYLSYGHHLEAARIFERLLANNVDPEIRDRTWFFLAKIWKQRGYLEQSQQALDRIEGELPKNLRREAKMLQAQIWIDMREYDRAVALLQDWQGSTEWASYAKFNLGVALVRSGRVDTAARILRDLGQMKPNNEEMTSLRDKANLALGYALLQDNQPMAAKPVLQRVRLEGPFSNKALLGVGWADAEREIFHRALVPWMELRSRDLLDSAVQESMLAIPYALAQLDSVSQAADHYLNAIEAFHEEINRLDRTILQIESGDLLLTFLSDDPLESTGWYWRLEELPDSVHSRYLFHLLSTHKFQEGLKNYRDLDYMRRNLRTWQQNVGVYRNMLETREQAYLDRLPRAQEALARADLAGMVDRKLEYESALKLIEDTNDWIALASKSESAMWREISGLEANPALQADLPEAAELRDKLALLKGVLQWNLEKHFKERLWRIRRDLRQTDEALMATQQARQQIDESMRHAPEEFSAFFDRVLGLEPRIESIRSRIENQMAKQHAYLQSIAVGELEAQKERLDIYTVQARFALAAIYDIATTVGELSR